MSYNIAVVDDSAADAGYVGGLAAKWAETRRIKASFSRFPSAEAFLFEYADDPAFDIILLDIEMEKMDGVTLARKLRKENETIQIIFVTGYTDYISEGYDVAALHYLIKPVKEEKIFSVLDRAAEKLKKNERCIILDNGGETARVPIYRIRWAEVHSNYVTVHADTDFTSRMPLSEFIDKLDERFYRVGRSTVVNLNFIARVTKTGLTLTDGSTLPIPRGAYEGINRAIIGLER